MKAFNVVGGLLTVLTLGLFIGCGGGSSGGGTSNVPAAATSELTAENMNGFVRKVSDKFGCEYTENAANKAVILRKENSIAVAMESAVRNIIDGKLNQALRALRTTETETTDGDCGGKLITTTNEDTGTMYLDFQNYCNGEVTGEQTVINGAIDAKMTGEEGLVVVTASTAKVLNVVTTNPDDKKVDISISLDSAVITIKGTISFDDLESLDVRVTVKSGSITDNTAGLSYSGKNLIATYKNGETEFSATFTDPDLGTVNVSGDMDENEQATINMVGSGGSNAKFSTSSQEGVFTVSTNNKVTGTMNCPVSDLPSLEALQ